MRSINAIWLYGKLGKSSLIMSFLIEGFCGKNQCAVDGSSLKEFFKYTKGANRDKRVVLAESVHSDGEIVRWIVSTPGAMAQGRFFIFTSQKPPQISYEMRRKVGMLVFKIGIDGPSYNIGDTYEHGDKISRMLSAADSKKKSKAK